ncbi:MAG: hypothetical protein ACRDJE_11450 [Dehalococcoidia bacterium]
MDRVRAALLGCLLAGGVIFGARPVLPERRLLRPVVYAAGPGSAGGRSPAAWARWFQPLPPMLEPAALAADLPAAAAPARHRCTGSRVRRRRMRRAGRRLMCA